MRNFLSNNKGASTVEFSLTVAIYLFIFFMIFEFCRLAITTAYWDLAIAESVRIARNQQAVGGDYETLFRNALKEQQKLNAHSTMGLFFNIQENNTDDIIKVKYVDCDKNNPCITALLNEKFRAPQKDAEGRVIPPNGINANLARYELEYSYKFYIPLPFLPSSWVKNIFYREIVMVQEYGF